MINLEDCIRKSIKEMFNIIAEEELAKAQKIIAERFMERVVNVGLTLGTHVNFERREDVLMIKIVETDIHKALKQ